MVGHQSLDVCWQKLQVGWRSARTNQATFLLADRCNLVVNYRIPKEAIPINSKATLPIPPINPPTEESAIAVMDQIRCRAYELYEQRGREDGYDIEDWLHAESEVIHRGETKAA